MNDFDVVTGPAPATLPEKSRLKPAAVDVPRGPADVERPSAAYLPETDPTSGG
jgi:hypothetical protein